MKLPREPLATHEYAFRQPEFARPSVKYDNRGHATKILQAWPRV